MQKSVPSSKKTHCISLWNVYGLVFRTEKIAVWFENRTKSVIWLLLVGETTGHWTSKQVLHTGTSTGTTLPRSALT